MRHLRVLLQRPEHLDALDAGHLHVEQQDVGDILLEGLERGVTVGDADRGVPLAGQLAHEELAKVLLIVSDEDADGTGHGPTSGAGVAPTGRITRKVAPAPGRELTSIRPP